MLLDSFINATVEIFSERFQKVLDEEGKRKLEAVIKLRREGEKYRERHCAEVKGGVKEAGRKKKYRMEKKNVGTFLKRERKKKKQEQVQG